MMRLQTKILLLLLAALVLSGVGLYMLQQALVLPSYLELEKIEAQKDALRCVETLRSEIDTLDVLLHDWSAWDDMYNFAKKPNESFVTSNLQSKTFTQNKWNLVYIFDQEDHLVWGRAMDLKTGRALSFPALDASPSRETGFLFGHRTINSVSKGVWLTPHGPMLTASRPIITSLFTPPIVGTAVMGRLLTDDYITKLAGKISVDFKIFPIPGGGKVKPSSHGSGPRGETPTSTDGARPVVKGKAKAIDAASQSVRGIGLASSTDNTPAGQSPREILKKLNETKPFYVVGSGKLLITYTWLPSLKGDSAILVQANIPRTIKRKGTQTIRILLASAFAVGLMVILILLIYLQRTIARPIAQLTDHTVNIRATDDLTLRCGSNRKDEIGILSREIDHMVHRIQELYSGMDAEIKYKTAELNQTGQRLTLETKERKETAESLRKSREFLRELFENAPFGIVRLNEDNLIVDVNKSFERIFLFSLDECQGKAIDQLIVPDGMETEAVSVSDRTFQGESSYLETVRKSKGGDLVDVRIHGIPIVLDGANIGIYGIYIDVTEEKRIQREREHLEAQLLDAKKMEAVGTLAGGMAHEFNNLMAVMMGNIDMLLGFGTEDDTQNRRLMGIKKSADKAARLTEQLLAFSRHQLLKLETLDLNDLIKSISYMVCSRYGENVELELRQSPNACYVKGDQNLLIQVLMDIVQNAAEAMTEGGQLTLTVEHAPKENNNKRQLKDEPVEDCACIIITDTGMGMEPETVEHIFEPFFTTKPVGQATGLGLAFVYGTIKQHNGRLEVTSKPGIGTTFRLYLPEIEAAT